MVWDFEGEMGIKHSREMPRLHGGHHRSASEIKERAVDLKTGKGSEEMFVSNYKLRLTLKLQAKKYFSLFFPGSSVAVRVCTASVPLCLVFPSVL